MSIHRAAETGDLTKLQALWTTEVDANKRDANGRTALICALIEGHDTVAAWLLEQGVDCNLAEQYERMRGMGRFTPLGIAASRGDVETVELLIRRGARIDFSWEERQKNSNPTLPLAAAILAAPAKSIKVVQLLLQAGANPNQFVEVGITLLDYAERWKAKRVITALQKAGAKTYQELRGETQEAVPSFTRLVEAARFGDLAAVERLLQEGKNPNQLHERMTPLQAAAMAGQEAIFHRLVQTGAQIVMGAEENYPLLNAAASGGSIPIVRFLLEQGQPIDGYPPAYRLANARSRSGPPNWHTPLMSAAGSGQLAMVQYLLEQGANLQAKQGTLTPLKWAKQAGHAHVVAYFESLGQTNFAKDPAKQILKNLPELVQSECVQAALQLLAEITERKPAPWKKRKGVYALFLGQNSFQRYAAMHQLPNMPSVEEAQLAWQEEVLDHLQEQLLAQQCQLLYHQEKQYLLFPTPHLDVPLIACGTNGINAGLDTEAVVAWLRNLAQTNPYRLTGCSFDWVSGCLLHPPTDPKTLAETMLLFCRDLQEGEDTIPKLSQQLAETGRFHFWWD